MSTVPSSRVLTALVTGVATTAYYATPDVVRSRVARGWIKTACMALIVAASAPAARDAWPELRSALRDGVDAPPGEGSTTDDRATGDLDLLDAVDANSADSVDSPSDASRLPGAVVAAAAVAFTVASVAGTVAAERWVFRRGEARAAAGVRFAHTRAAVLLGALNAASTFIPDPPKRP